MELAPEQESRGQVARLFAREQRRLTKLLGEARIEHVGATAVPGSLTKGDLDICAVVSPERFESAVAALRSNYETHQLENWNSAYASFTAPADVDVAIGVQLVAAGSEDERSFVGWRDRLIAEPSLLRRYNELKLDHESNRPEDYREAKAGFINAESN
jgi:GrpB-like predicted nucleotidyltransferase (UPF0157 family)